MHVRSYFTAILFSLPFYAVAQHASKTKANNNTQKKDRVVLAANTKTISDTMLVNTTKGNDYSSSSSAKLALANVSSQQPKVHTPTVWDDNSPYKEVPMVGNLKYFGNHHSQILAYTKTYMHNYHDRLDNMNTPSRGGKAFPIIDKIMDENQMPRELKYLAVIESALNNKATSPVGAAGPWQFMAPTARNMGLVVNSRRDDRRDWYKSTKAACKYLNYLYDQFDDWLLVIAAYNSGPRPVINAMNRTGKSDFWSIKKYLPKETQNHVMAFVATATIMERLDDYLGTGLPANFNWATLNIDRKASIKKEEPPKNPLLARFGETELKKMAIVRIKSVIDLDLLCNVIHTDRREIGRWNYDYYTFMDGYKSGDTYNLRIPKDKLDSFIENMDFIVRQSAKNLMQ